MIEYIKSKVKVNGKLINVFVRKYDTDFKKVTKPCASVYVTGFTKDPTRQSPFGTEIVLGKDKVNKTVSMQKSGTAVEYTYSIDFWSETQSEFNIMTEQWLLSSSFSKWFNLPVKDSKGLDTTLLCLERTGVVSQTEVEENKEADNYRLFHSSQVYSIYTYYEGEVYDAPMVTDVSFDTEVLK